MSKSYSPWRLWAKSLGEKASSCNKESDKVAIVRTIIFLTYLITNCFIVAGVIRHWNSPKYILIPIQTSDTYPLHNYK